MTAKRWLVLVALAGGGSIANITALAHHGGIQEWRIGEEAGPIRGVVTEFAFRFPHVQISLDVTDESGAAQSWTMVMRWTPTILRQHGWTRNTIVPGDEITVTYTPHVRARTVGNIQRLEINGEFIETQF